MRNQPYYTRPYYNKPSNGSPSRWIWLVVAVVAVIVMFFSVGLRLLRDASIAAAPPPYVAPAFMPELPTARLIAPGIYLSEVTLTRAGVPQKLWVYQPGAPYTGKRPCILIAPAGTPLIYGMDLGEGDQPEHLPYVRAGYIVVAYELDGKVSKDAGDDETRRGIEAFMRADAGIANARCALEYALAKVTNVDPKRIYTAGHSSAATLSLQEAENEPRIAGCIAYAPCCDVPGRLGAMKLALLGRAVPGIDRLLEQRSPDRNTAKLRCPVFLFHADDDSNVPTDEVANFAEKLKQTNKQVTFARVPTGEHYDSMIEQGIPQAIRWLQSLPAPDASR